jgi:hypothetical protein
MISSVRLDGTSATRTIVGATDTELFQAYARNVLVPSPQPGDIVIMDKLGAHRNDCALAIITQAEPRPASRLLRAYSQDLNLIGTM